jgi:hypothetical protein
MTDLFGSPIVDCASVGYALDSSHYLGAARRGFAWSDDDGIVVLASPTSRRLPADRWLELVRWCLSGRPNAGSQQWARIRAYLLAECPDVTTVVSYSDPSVGHTGSLYRACGWLWAPTWHRLRPPPSANGTWSNGEVQAVKDRWVDVLSIDDDRARLLAIGDESLRRRFPDAEYREPRFKRGRPVRGTGGGRWTVMREIASEAAGDASTRVIHTPGKE